MINCRDCYYWDPEDDREGACRRHAPKAYAWQIVEYRRGFSNDNDTVFVQTAGWPRTHAGDCCGEASYKMETTPAPPPPQ